MSTAPAVCENPKCRKVFIVPVASLPIGSIIRMEGCKGRPCPACGSWGIIPDGEYRNTSEVETLFTPRSWADRQFLKSALDLAMQGASGELSVEEFREKVTKEAPELASLWDHMPTTREELYQFCIAICAVLGILISIYHEFRQPDGFAMPKHAVDAVQSARPAAPAGSRPSTHSAGSKKQPKAKHTRKGRKK